MSNTNNASTVYHQGGAIGVTFGQGNSAPDIPNVDSLNGDMGSGRITINHDGSQSIESLAVNRVNVGQDHIDRRNAAASILDTARTPWGTPAAKLEASSIVMVHGMETSLGAAEQMGLVRRDAQGNYVEIQSGTLAQQGQPQGQPQGQQQGEPQNGDGDHFALPAPILDAINEAIDPIPQHIYEGSIHKALNLGFDSLDYRALGDEIGTNEADARARVTSVAQAYQVHAGQAIKSIVSEPGEALQWAASEKPKEFARAMTQLIFGNSTTELKALASQFMKAVDPDDSTLKAAGFETKAERDGTRMIRVGNQWMTLRAAVKAGIV